MDDERALINLVPDRVKEAMLKLPEEWRDIEEGYIRKILRPNVTDNQLRASFWLEYNNVQHHFLKKMAIGHIIRGICSENFFYSHYVTNEKRLAYLLTPPVFYIAKLEHLMQLATERMEEILQAPVMDADGKINTKVSNLQMKIYMMLDMRAKGAYTQRIELEGKTLNLDVRAGVKDIVGITEQMNMEDIERRLNELQKKEAKALAKAQELPTPIDTVYRKELDTIETTSVEVPAQEPLIEKPKGDFF